ncbi:MAG: hypothetical protein RL339_2599 [Pseudomonadota bacterium]
MQTAGGLPAYAEHSLEREATRMGELAQHGASASQAAPQPAALAAPGNGVAQLVPKLKGKKKGAKKHGGIGKNNWYRRRHRTAYGSLDPSGKRTRQGPHTVPHIMKVVMAERSVKKNPAFNPLNIPMRSGLLPSPGQSRALLNQYEKQNKVAIPLAHKRAFNERNKRLAHQISNVPTTDERQRAVTALMEHNPLVTYALARPYTPAEIAGGGENQNTVAPDLDRAEKMTKHGPMPKFGKLDIPPGEYQQKHIKKLLRDIGKVSRGEEDLSDMEIDSDDETGY